MANDIVSLCYIDSRKDKTCEACRIADYVGSGFRPYSFDSSKAFCGTERDLLRGSATDIQDDIGGVSVYKWSVSCDSGKWRTNLQESDISWVEVVMTSAKDIEELIEKLKSGIPQENITRRKHDMIFCYGLNPKSIITNSTITKAIFVPADDIAADGTEYTFADQVTTVETGSLCCYGDTGTCRCRYSPNNAIRYLLRADRWHPAGNVSILSTQEVVSEAVSAFIRRLSKDKQISRKERQIFLSVMEKLSAQTIADEVAAKLECSREKAIGYIEEYLCGATCLIEEDEADRVMRMLIENDSEYAQEMLSRVKQTWETANDAKLKAWDAEKQQMQTSLESLQQDIQKEKDHLADLQSEAKNCEEKALKAIQLQSDIEKEIQGKLNDVRENRAKAMVDNAWLLSAISPVVSAQAKENCMIECDKSTELIEEISLQDRWDDAIHAWRTVCSDESRSVGLAAFFIAAFIRRQHLLISGEFAERLADLAAQIVTGKTCLKIYNANQNNITEMIEQISKASHDCICFVDGLGQDQTAIKVIMHHFADSHCIITAQHFESLSMEPASLFTAFFPVCSEVFCAGDDYSKIEKYSCKAELQTSKYKNINSQQLRSIRARQSMWFTGGFYAPMLIERCARLQYTIQMVLSDLSFDSEKEAKKTMLSMVFVPLMKCLRKKDAITENLSEFDVLDENAKTRLLAFTGIERA